MQANAPPTPSMILEILSARGALELLDAICEARGVTRDDVCGRRRTKVIALARHELWWHLYTDSETPMSFEAIGRIFGRNRTSTMRGVRVYHRLRRLLRALPIARAAMAAACAPAAAYVPEGTAKPPTETAA